MASDLPEQDGVGDEGERLSPDAVLLKLMAMLQELLGESSLQTMKSRLEVFQQRMQARAAELGL